MIDNINVLVLAYLGDSVYETYVRNYLIDNKLSNINDLHKESLKYSPATKQALYAHMLINNKLLTAKEENILMRARNHKSAHLNKNASAVEYKYATGLEAVIGYLYLEKNNKRIEEIMQYILERGNYELS